MTRSISIRCMPAGVARPGPFFHYPCANLPGANMPRSKSLVPFSTRFGSDLAHDGGHLVAVSGEAAEDYHVGRSRELADDEVLVRRARVHAHARAQERAVGRREMRAEVGSHLRLVRGTEGPVERVGARRVSPVVAADLHRRRRMGGVERDAIKGAVGQEVDERRQRGRLDPVGGGRAEPELHLAFDDEGNVRQQIPQRGHSREPRPCGDHEPVRVDRGPVIERGAHAGGTDVEVRDPGPRSQTRPATERPVDMSLGACFDAEVAGVLLEDAAVPRSGDDREARADVVLRQADVRQAVSFDALEHAADGRMVLRTEVQATDAFEEPPSRARFELAPEDVRPREQRHVARVLGVRLADDARLAGGAPAEARHVVLFHPDDRGSSCGEMRERGRPHTAHAEDEDVRAWHQDGSASQETKPS